MSQNAWVTCKYANSPGRRRGLLESLLTAICMGKRARKTPVEAIRRRCEDREATIADQSRRRKTWAQVAGEDMEVKNQSRLGRLDAVVKLPAGRQVRE